MDVRLSPEGPPGFEQTKRRLYVYRYGAQVTVVFWVSNEGLMGSPMSFWIDGVVGFEKPLDAQQWAQLLMDVAKVVADFQNTT